MVRRALFKRLPDIASNYCPQLKATELFSTRPLHDLRIEVMNRYETLMASLTDRKKPANVVSKYRPGSGQKFDGECSYCSEYGHMRRVCKKWISDEQSAASGGGGGGRDSGSGGGRTNSGKGTFAYRNKHNPYIRNPKAKNPFKQPERQRK